MMTAEEFRSAREALGLTPEQVAAEFDLTPKLVEALEGGRAPVPRGIARQLAFRAALARRERVLAESGLAECEVLDELLARMLATADADPEVHRRATQAVESHAERCPLCIERANYADAHAGPLPDFPFPWWMRVLQGLGAAAERLPGPLRPDGRDGRDGRARGLRIALGLSVVTLLGGAAWLGWRFANGAGLPDGGWREVLVSAIALTTTFLIAGALGGALFDLTHPLRHRWSGYVLRGLAVGAGICAVVISVMALEGSLRVTSGDGLLLVGLLGAIFAAAGGVFGLLTWVAHHVEGRIPARDDAVADETRPAAELLLEQERRASRRARGSWVWAGVALLTVIARAWLRESSASAESAPDDEPAIIVETREAVRRGPPEVRDSAIARLDAAVRAAPTDAVLRRQLAWALGTAQRVDEALQAADSAVRLEPDEATGHYLRGWALRRLERYPEAAAAFRRSLLLDPSRHDVEHDLGITLLQQAYVSPEIRLLNEALRHVDVAIAAAPEVAAYHAGRAQVLNALEQPADAAAAQRRALELEPGEAEHWVVLGWFAQRSGNYAEAERAFAKAVELDPRQATENAMLIGCRAAARERRGC